MESRAEKAGSETTHANPSKALKPQSPRPPKPQWPAKVKLDVRLTTEPWHRSLARSVERRLKPSVMATVVQVMDLSTMAYLLLIAAYICVSR